MQNIKPFYMVRHGESESNRLGVMAGWTDTPLTAEGRAQARALADCIGVLAPRPDGLVHSALSRARDTGLALNAALKLPTSCHEGLNERHFGLWAGTPAGPVFEKLARGEEPPEGESLPVFTDRVFGALSDIFACHERPLIAAHGGVFDAIAYRYHLRIDDVENCGLYGFEPEENGRPFPWRLWHYQKDGRQLRRVCAARCLHPL